ncbi:hypothetical protein B0H19DRAFT_935770 [Mycena capillaripes]|nr:hypothetical protein B0H19DRAFT_935770 [Mycena capillaripes]
MIKNEARTYNAFPDHLSEDWSGFNAIGEAANRYTDGLVPATAVVPKFYGYFVPSEELAETSNSRASPILLMEECGRPIEPKEMQQAERNICFTFPHSLYYEDFIQNSFSARNILVQPGPLTHPPDQRSLVTPSFRLIDFGRARWLDGSFDERVAFSNERKMAEDTIFGKKRKFVQGHDVWCEGKLERAFWMWAREWVFKPHDPHHHWHMDPFAKYV